MNVVVRRTATGVALAIIALTSVFSDGRVRAASQSLPSQQAVLPPQLARAADEDKLTYWVVLRDRADLAPASGMPRDARGRFVVDRLRAAADRSQAGLRAMLRARGADFAPFWAANVVRVTSDKATLDAIARRPEVERIEVDRVFSIPEPVPGGEQATIQGVEWNVANVRSPEAWAAFGVRGEGIVVGSIDTGVQYDHPALVNQYRGNVGGGYFGHDYNWYDPSRACGNPSTIPCDNNNHGTHTMGTIIGDDGGANQIGVAPRARWITAKGCESSSCSLSALVAAGQWMLAPTDLAGQNPNPDLRPHIVSNSWGGTTDTFYVQIVQSWVAAGIFPVFATGNTGPSCGTASSPGNYAESYAVGAYDASNLIASFSSRGASALGGVKPDISAPGVNVRSAIRGNGYAAYSGTSMATPHVAGIVALMWSAAPVLVRDTAATMGILDRTALDVPDASCGGTPGNNNVYGEGRVDAFAAVDASPRGPTGTLQGTVTNAVTGSRLAGMAVRAVGPTTATTVTNAVGSYAFTLPAGSYDVTTSGFGYIASTAHGVSIAEGAATAQDFAVAPAPSASIVGAVRNTDGAPIANATVRIIGTPIAPATSDASGAYRFDAVPAGTYDVRAEVGRCNDPQTQTLQLAADQQLDFALPRRVDSFGYSCALVPQTWISGTNILPLAGDDAVVSVPLPFTFHFYGSGYGTAHVATNGFLTFAAATSAYSNTLIPSSAAPNAAVYPFWDDLIVDASSSVGTATVGQSPDRRFVIEWRNVVAYGDSSARVDFEVVLGETGEILVQYRNVGASEREQGNSATIGLENASGTVALQYAANEAVLADGLSIRYGVAALTGVHGIVRDGNAGLAIGGAIVRALQNGSELQRANTDATGYYQLNLPAGTYLIEASASNYETASASVTIANAATTQDFALRATASPYDQRVNAGGPGYAGGSGSFWSPDAAYAVGQWGYTNLQSTVDRTKRTIASTPDVGLFQTQRIDPAEYRFDGLAAGTYEVTVGFAEFRQVKPGARVFDVVAEGATVLAAHDVMSHAGTLVADVHTFTIAVNDGQLNLAFLPRQGSLPAIVNAIRVVRRQ